MKKFLIVAPVLFLLAVTASGALAQAEYKAVDFNTLARYNYDRQKPWDLTPKKIDPTGVPSYIWPLDGKKISITGLAMPLSWDKEGSDQFLLTISEDACEFGITPRINEWIIVKMVGGKKVRVVNGDEYVVRGTFHLTERVDAGKVIELYAIDGESVTLKS